MRYVHKKVPMRTRHHISHQEFTCDEVEALVAVGTGLAIAPINEDKSIGATFASCTTWTLMHLESGLYLGEPFPANEAFAKVYLEEVNKIAEAHLSRAELEASSMKKQTLGKQMRKARQRIESQFAYAQESLFS